MHEETSAAGLTLVLAVEVHASERILEDEGGTAGGVRRSSIPTVFEKTKLELEKIQEVAIIFFQFGFRFGHGGLR